MGTQESFVFVGKSHLEKDENWGYPGYPNFRKRPNECKELAPLGASRNVDGILMVYKIQYVPHKDYRLMNRKNGYPMDYLKLYMYIYKHYRHGLL